MLALPSLWTCVGVCDLSVHHLPHLQNGVTSPRVCTLRGAEPPTLSGKPGFHAAIVFQLLLDQAPHCSDLTVACLLPSHWFLPSRPSSPLLPSLPSPRLCSTPGIDLANRGLNCVHLTNGSAGSAQDGSYRPELGWKRPRGRLGGECRVQAGLRKQGPCQSLLTASALGTEWPTHCPSAAIPSGGCGNGSPGEPGRILENLPPPPSFSPMRLLRPRLSSDLRGKRS